MTTICNAQVDLPIKIVFVARVSEIGHVLTSVEKLQQQGNVEQ